MQRNAREVNGSLVVPLDACSRRRRCSPTPVLNEARYPPRETHLQQQRTDEVPPKCLPRPMRELRGFARSVSRYCSHLRKPYLRLFETPAGFISGVGSVCPNKTPITCAFARYLPSRRAPKSTRKDHPNRVICQYALARTTMQPLSVCPPIPAMR